MSKIFSERLINLTSLVFILFYGIPGAPVSLAQEFFFPHHELWLFRQPIVNSIKFNNGVSITECKL